VGTRLADGGDLAVPQDRLALARRPRCRSCSTRGRHSHVQFTAPALLDEPGIGSIVAAQLLLAWSHHGPVRSEAAFARLAGVAPLPASSGRTVRHRLSRGGDRRLNRALHTIVVHRRQHDPATTDYIARRIAEGKSGREATRLLKRYVARHIYRLLEQEPTMT
jgi:transposase